MYLSYFFILASRAGFQSRLYQFLAIAHFCFLLVFSSRNPESHVLPPLFQHLWPAIADALDRTLGDRYTASVNVAWMHIFTYIGSKLMEGISKLAYSTI